MKTTNESAVEKVFVWTEKYNIYKEKNDSDAVISHLLVKFLDCKNSDCSILFVQTAELDTIYKHISIMSYHI